MRPTIALILSFLAAASAAPAQSISGTLMETETRSPIARGVVTLLDRDSTALERVQTDSVGAFSFTLERGGSFRISAERAGFRAAASPRLTIGSRDTLEVEFSLARDAVVLEPLVVTARSRYLTPAARRFYQRAKSSPSGRFITLQEIEQAHASRTTELLRRVPGVVVTPMMGGNDVRIRGTCRPSVYVDGTRVQGYRSIDDLAQPLELEGIEVYRSADQAPAEFTGVNAGCAAILIWTRIE